MSLLGGILYTAIHSMKSSSATNLYFADILLYFEVLSLPVLPPSWPVKLRAESRFRGAYTRIKSWSLSKCMCLLTDQNTIDHNFQKNADLHAGHAGPALQTRQTGPRPYSAPAQPSSPRNAAQSTRSREPAFEGSATSGGLLSMQRACMSQGVIMPKVGLVAAPDRAELLPSAGHARFEIGCPEHRVQQHPSIACARSGRCVSAKRPSGLARVTIMLSLLTERL